MISYYTKFNVFAYTCVSVYICKNTETEIEKLRERDQWVLDSLEGIGGFHFTLCPSLYILLRFQAVVFDTDSLICIKEKSGGISEFWKFSSNFSFFVLFFFLFLFIWRLITLQYCTGLPYIDMNPPWVYMCLPS